MNPTRSVRVANGCLLQITEIACPIYIVLPTNFEPEMLDPFELAVMPSINYVLSLGCLTLGILGLDIYGLMECARRKDERRATAMGVIKYIVYQPMSMSVEGMQQ